MQTLVSWLRETFEDSSGNICDYKGLSLGKKTGEDLDIKEILLFLFPYYYDIHNYKENMSGICLYKSNSMTVTGQKP